jgi:hypothetical protein
MMPALRPLASPPIPEPDPELEDSAYHGQMVVADVATLALVFVGGEAGISAAGLTYLIAGPSIHLAHGQGHRAAGSLALRLGVPVVGAFGAAWLARSRDSCSEDDEDCDDGALVAAVLGAGAGMLAAMLIDDAMLSGPVRRKPARVEWAPRVTATTGRLGVGVVGRF